jgi:putative transposase
VGGRLGIVGRQQPRHAVGACGIAGRDLPDLAHALERGFQAWATKKSVAVAGRRLEDDWERLVTSYMFPKEHWKHLRTTNVVESPFAAVRLRTAAAKRFKKVENATAIIRKTLLVVERSFRRLDAPELLPGVAEGVVYVDGVTEKRGNEKAAAWSSLHTY